MGFTGKTSQTTAVHISNDGFWPDVSVGDLLNNYRIPSEYTDGVTKTGLIMSLTHINQALKAVKDAVLLIPLNTLEEYCDANVNEINGLPVLITHYKHAVYCRAKADLLKQFNSLNRKPNAENAAKESDDQQDYWLDQSQASIKAIFTQVLPDDTSVSSMANVHISLI